MSIDADAPKPPTPKEWRLWCLEAAIKAGCGPHEALRYAQSYHEFVTTGEYGRIGAALTAD